MHTPHTTPDRRLAADRYSVLNGLARTADGTVRDTITYSYETQTVIYDVRQFTQPDGSMRWGFRINMGAWETEPQLIHRAILAHFNLGRG